MKKFNFAFVFFILIYWTSFAHEGPAAQQILNYANEISLPRMGILKTTGTFVYVDVEDAYIHKLVELIQQEGFEEPPYFGAADLVGAHISVVYPDEVATYGIYEIEEIGEEVEFILKECKVVHPPNWKEIDQVYFIVVEAPKLDTIRAKYGLPKRAYDYHITLGVKPK